MKPNRSIIFKSAHAILKMQNVTFSEALKMSWLCFKNQVRVIVTESWNKIKRVAFTKNGSTSGNIENVILSVGSVVNNDGARYDYGCGIYTGD